MKKSIFTFLLSSLLGSVFYLIIGWLVFDLLLGAYTEAHTTQLPGFKKTTDFSFVFLYLSCLAYAVLINLFLFNSTIQSIQRATLFTAVFGMLVACMANFYWYASSNFYLNFTVVCLDIMGAALAVGALGGFTFFFIRKIKGLKL